MKFARSTRRSRFTTSQRCANGWRAPAHRSAKRALLVAAFALLALTLAGAGVFGVLSHLVARQTAEFGVRMALGAQANDLLRLVLKRGLGPAAGGVAIGMAATTALGRFVESLLFGVRPTDLAAVFVTLIALLVVAALACYLPARRAAKLDPASALRID